MKVIVVGAGFSGLSAAYYLHKQGVEVVIIEARNRVGGRVYSKELENGEVAELGGEWIIEDDELYNTLINEMGLSKTDIGVNFMVREPMDGAHLSFEDCINMNRKVNAKMAAYSKKEIAAMSIQDLLNQIELSTTERSALTSRLQVSNGASLDKIALRNMGTFGTSEKQSHYFRIDDGNQNLAKSLAAKLPEVILNTPVIGIEQTAEGIEVLTENKKFSADKVVLSAPISVLNKIKFNPSLPKEIQSAIDVTNIGSGSKLAAVLKDEPPIIAKQNTDAPYWCWTGQAFKNVNKKIITAFCGSETAREILKTSNLNDPTWFESIRDNCPELNFSGEYIKKDWQDDPWVLGTYTALNNEAYDALDVFSKPFLNIHFAGEHTKAEFSGTMNGALNTGVIAAKQIMQDKDC